MVAPIPADDAHRQLCLFCKNNRHDDCQEMMLIVVSDLAVRVKCECRCQLDTNHVTQ